MAYLRIEKKSSGDYLSIVESYREGGKTRKRVLYQLGNLKNYSPETLRNIGTKLYTLGGGSLPALLGEELEELGRYDYGAHQVYEKLFKEYGLPRFFAWVVKKHQLGFDLGSVVLLMLLDRLQNPQSKLSSWRFQKEYLGFPELSLHWLYRGLDKLNLYQDRIQSLIYQQGRDLFNSVLDVVFYDVTTFYFESEQEDTLRQKGYGKDGKIGKTQILFGMLVDAQKRPICYEVYEGSTYEGHTFKDALERLKQKYQIGKVIVVADRGMLSKSNLEYIQDIAQYDFIIGERLKNLPKNEQKYLLDFQNYTAEWTLEEEKVQYACLTTDTKTIIGTYSAKRAKRDAAQRATKLEKAEKLLQKPTQLKNKAARYFLKNIGEQAYELDQEKIKASEQFDGFLTISTNVKNLSVTAILEQYKNLYQIEHCFRTFKSYLETRPMFHWNPVRIKGHLCLCYIAYTLQNHLQILLQQNKLPHSENHIRRTLQKMQVSLIKKQDEHFYLRADLSKDQEQILQAMKIKKLPHLIPKNDLEKHINIGK